MKTEELKKQAIKALGAADTPTTADWGKVSAFKAIAWAILYFADVFRYKILIK